MLSLQEAMRKFGLRTEHLKTVPFITCIPGNRRTYNLRECRTRAVFVDHLSEREAGITLHGSVEAMDQYASKVIAQELKQWRGKRQIWRSPNPKPYPKPFDFPISGCQGTSVPYRTTRWGCSRSFFGQAGGISGMGLSMLSLLDRGIGWFPALSKLKFLEHVKELGMYGKNAANFGITVGMIREYVILSGDARSGDEQMGKERKGDFWTLD